MNTREDQLPPTTSHTINMISWIGTTYTYIRTVEVEGNERA